VAHLWELIPNLKPKIRNIEWDGPCPICGGKDRFFVRILRDGAEVYNCRRCGFAGDIITWVRYEYHFSFREALEFLHMETPIKKTEFVKPKPEIHLDVHLDLSPILDAPNYIYDYYKRWGLTRETLSQFKIQYYDSDHYKGFAIPHYYKGFLSDMNVRKDERRWSDGPKYRSVTGSHKCGYYHNEILSTWNLDYIGPFLDHCFVVESEKDVMLMTQMGFNAVAYRGPKEFLYYTDNIFSNVMRPILIADNDSPEKGMAFSKRIKKSFERNVDIVMIEKYKQPSDMAEAVGVENTKDYITEKFL